MGQPPLKSLNPRVALELGSKWDKGQIPAKSSSFRVSPSFLPSLLPSQTNLSLVGVRDVGVEKWITY